MGPVKIHRSLGFSRQRNAQCADGRHQQAAPPDIDPAQSTPRRIGVKFCSVARVCHPLAGPAFKAQGSSLLSGPATTWLRGERQCVCTSLRSPFALSREVTMSHARPITTQGEWDKRHQREQQRQMQREIISRMTLIVSALALVTAFYFVVSAD